LVLLREMKHIVVLTDFEDYTHNAINYAVYLANLTSATLSIFDSSKSSNAQTFSAPLIQIIRNDVFAFPPGVKAYLNSLLDTFSESILKTIHVVYKSQNEFDLEEIQNNHEQNTFDLLVLSTKEKQGIFNKIFRSNVSKLIEKASYPVLVIPNKIKFTEIHKFAFTTNLEESEQLNVEFAYDLSKLCNTKFRLVHIYSTSSKKLEDQKARFISLIEEKLGNDDFIFKEFQNDDLYNGLKDYTEKNTNCILCIKKNTKSGLEKLINKSPTEKLMFGAFSPILVYTNGKDLETQLLTELQRKTTQ